MLGLLSHGRREVLHEHAKIVPDIATVEHQVGQAGRGEALELGEGHRDVVLVA